MNNLTKLDNKITEIISAPKLQLPSVIKAPTMVDSTAIRIPSIQKVATPKFKNYVSREASREATGDSLIRLLDGFSDGLNGFVASLIDSILGAFDKFTGVLTGDSASGDAPVRSFKPMPHAVYGVPANISGIVYDRLKVEGLDPITIGFVGEGSEREFQFSVVIKLYKVCEEIMLGMGLKNRYRRIK